MHQQYQHSPQNASKQTSPTPPSPFHSSNTPQIHTSRFFTVTQRIHYRIQNILAHVYHTFVSSVINDHRYVHSSKDILMKK